MALLMNDTVRMTATFEALDDGSPFDPVRVEFTPYDETGTALEEAVDVTTNRVSEGVYFADYVTPGTGYAVVLEMTGYDAADRPHRIARMERLRFA